MTIDGKTLGTLASIAALFALLLGGWTAADRKHAQQVALDAVEARAAAELAAAIAQSEVANLRRLLAERSTRYAEIEKHYTDVMAEGEQLSEAQLARLELVQRQQIEINRQLAER